MTTAPRYLKLSTTSNFSPLIYVNADVICSNCTAASTSIRKIGWLSVLVAGGTIIFSGSPSTVWLYSSAQYSVHLFRISLVSVRQIPGFVPYGVGLSSFYPS